MNLDNLDFGALLQTQLGGLLTSYLGQQGESAESSSKAVGLALPALVAGMLKSVTSNPANAGSLFNLINGEQGQQLEAAAAQAQGGNLDTLMGLGKNLLPNLLGGNGAEVAEQVSEQSGVSKVAAGSLITLALPLILSVLRGQSLNQGQLLGLLGQQQGWLSQALNSKMLSALGIGSLGEIISKVSSIGSSFSAGSAAPVAAAAASAGGSGLGKWLGLGAAVLLGLFALKSCGGKSDAPQAPAAASAASAAPAPETKASEPAPASAPAASAPASAPGEPAASAPASAPGEPAASAPASAPAAASVPAAAASAATPAADVASVAYENAVAKFYFATGKSNVADGAEKIVGDVIAAGKEGKKLIVSGYTDTTGNAAANEELSKTRAKAVKAFFEAQGVSADNIELRKPDNTNGAVGNNAEGRRVEVKVAE